ncbi:MAG: F0F1 ATP synthase subunit delta [Minisyncoccota bacterium]
MTIARDYAHALTAVAADTPEGKEDIRIQRFLSHVRDAGHIKLLPKIMYEIEKEIAFRQDKARVTFFLARSDDKERYHDAMIADAKVLGVDSNHATIAIDPHLIGGYMIKTRDRLFDKSIKHTLIDLYHRMRHASITTYDHSAV